MKKYYAEYVKGNSGCAVHLLLVGSDGTLRQRATVAGCRQALDLAADILERQPADAIASVGPVHDAAHARRIDRRQALDLLRLARARRSMGSTSHLTGPTIDAVLRERAGLR